MERSELIDMLGSLQLAGMRANLDEILTRGRKRRHSVEETIAELLKVEIAEKQARSIRYQLGAAKMPLASAGWMAQSMSGRPARCLMFFFGIETDPPRAGMIATTRGVDIAKSCETLLWPHKL